MIADFLDSAFLDFNCCLLALMILWAIYHLGEARLPFMDSFDSFSIQLLLMSLRVVLSLVYYTFGSYWYGSTLGKQVFGISVVSSDLSPISFQQSLIRFFSYLVSYLSLGAGFLITAFHPEKKAFHDCIAGTVSIVKRRHQKQ